MKANALWWVITGQCHLKCQHCYIEAPFEKYHQLSFPQCLEVIEQAKQAGIEQIFLTGGEPFVREDLIKIINHIYKNGMFVSGIETNACLIDKKIIDQIADKKIKWHISHDGKLYHDHIRKVKGSEKKSLETIKQLIKRGFRVSINSVLTQENFRSLLNSYQLLKNLNIYSWQVFSITPIGLSKGKKSLMISPKEEANFYLKLITLWYSDNKPFQLSLGGVFDSNNEKKVVQKKKKIC